MTFPLGLLLRLSWPLGVGRHRRTQGIILAAVVVLVLAGVEPGQAVSPMRSADAMDMLVAMTGGIVGLLSGGPSCAGSTPLDVWSVRFECRINSGRRALAPERNESTAGPLRDALRPLLDRLPATVRGRLRAAVRRVPLVGRFAVPAAERHLPPGTVRWGSLRRTGPFSRQWGYDRGTPVDRIYIEQFVRDHGADVRG